MCKPTTTTTSTSTTTNEVIPKEEDEDVIVELATNEKGFKQFDGHTPGKFRKSKGLWIVAGLATISCMFNVWNIVKAIQLGTFAYWKNVGIVITAYFLIDVFSGLLHIVLDNPWFATNPNILRGPAIGFQEHHLNVNLIGKLSLQQHLSPMGIPIVLNCILGQFMAYTFRDDNDDQCLYHTVALSTAFFLVLMQMAHRWSHVSLDKRPYGVTTLQKWGILVSASEHSKHHRPPYESHFCIMSGIMNPIMNYVVTNIMSPHSKNWVYVFIAFVMVPHIVITMV